MNFEIIKKNFDSGLWTEGMVRAAVKKGVITKEQFKDIVGKKY